MNTILYIQSKSSNEADTIVIDKGEPVAFTNSNYTHIEAARMLNSATDWMMIPPKNMDGNLRCYRSEKGIYVQSNYVETDEVGRRIAFRFYTDSQSLDTVCKLLKEISANHNCDEKELEALKRRGESVNQCFLFYQKTLIDGNGNVVKDSCYDKFVKTPPEKSWCQHKMQFANSGYYFVEKYPLVEGKILFIESQFDDKTDSFKFRIKQPNNNKETINTLTNLAKYFGKCVSDSDMNTLKNLSDYGESKRN